MLRNYYVGPILIKWEIYFQKGYVIHVKFVIQFGRWRIVFPTGVIEHIVLGICLDSLMRIPLTYCLNLNDIFVLFVVGYVIVALVEKEKIKLVMNPS